jgi:hypothetical protein
MRPDSWNYLLLLHVLGAMVLVGGLLAGVAALAFARGETRLLRLGYWSLLAVALPGYVAMRIGAELLYAKEEDVNPQLEDAVWVGMGYIIADIGALLLLVTLILGGIGVRKLRTGGGAGLLKAAMVISLLILVAALVAVWAMSAKPT